MVGIICEPQLQSEGAFRGDRHRPLRKINALPFVEISGFSKANFWIITAFTCHFLPPVRPAVSLLFGLDPDPG
jgi:hypothetical protein